MLQKNLWRYLCFEHEQSKNEVVILCKYFEDEKAAAFFFFSVGQTVTSPIHQKNVTSNSDLFFGPDVSEALYKLR